MIKTWNIVQLNAYPEYAGQQNIVFTVHWTLTATEADYLGYTYGSIGLELDPEAIYTPYNELTQEQVLTWVHNALGQDQVAAHETSVAQQIETQINPPVVTPPLPWA
jgi:hypothetical protein